MKIKAVLIVYNASEHVHHEDGTDYKCAPGPNKLTSDPRYIPFPKVKVAYGD